MVSDELETAGLNGLERGTRKHHRIRLGREGRQDAVIKPGIVNAFDGGRECFELLVGVSVGIYGRPPSFPVLR